MLGLRRRALLIDESIISKIIIDKEEEVSKNVLDEFIHQVDVVQEIINTASMLMQIGHLYKENEEECKALISFVNSKAQLPSHGDVQGILNGFKDHYEILCEIGNELEKIFRNTPKQLLPNTIMSLYASYGYYPEPWQILICTSSTTMEELKIFIKRSFYASNQFSLEAQEINELNANTLQEVYQELFTNITCISSDLSGQGKTEWIKEVSYSKQKIPLSFLISDNMNLKYLVNKLKAFSYNNVIVSIPDTFIFIEISSSANQNLLRYLPILRFSYHKYLNWNIENFRVSQEITSPIQIVCHYLKLYDLEKIDTEENLGHDIKYPLPEEFCQHLIMKYFLNKSDKYILSFKCIEIFVNILADQLIRFLSSQYFTINDLKLNLKEANIGSTIIKSLLSTSKDFINQFDNSNYNIYFFNPYTLNSYILYNNKNEVPDNIKLLLNGQELEDYNTMTTTELLIKLETIARRSNEELNFPEYALTTDNLMKMALILLRVRANIPVVICGEAGCSKTSLITYLAMIVDVQLCTLNIHAELVKKIS
ncbi:unnamed protein product [Rhizophagus irregularis]|nr:unnamed protein product [Rhizophagus irregularis]